MLSVEQIGLLNALAHEVREDLVILYDYAFFDEVFCGACAIASWLLREKAREHGIELILAAHSEHCWLETPEGTVVDPTFSQFAWELGENSGYDVLIGTRTEAHDPDTTWVKNDWVRRDREAEKFLYRWDPMQSPVSPNNKPILSKYLEKSRIGEAA